MTKQERTDTEAELERLKGWKGDKKKIDMLERRLQHDDEKQAHDERKGRWKRSR